MSFREQAGWLKAYLVILAIPFAVIFLFALTSPGAHAPSGKELAQLLFWPTLWVSLAYLLILSWRAAYLSGRNEK